MPVPGILENIFNYLSDSQLNILEAAAKQGIRNVPMNVAQALSLTERQVLFQHLADDAKRQELLKAVAAFRAAQSKR